MTLLAEIADAVVGVDTHRDTHTLQIAHPTGVPIAELVIHNGAAGYTQAIAWARHHSPGPRLFFALEGSRSYGIGLARAVSAAGLPVLEVVRSGRDNRRRRGGKTDQIDAGLAVLVPCAWTSPGCPRLGLMETARHCASCWTLAMT